MQKHSIYTSTAKSLQRSSHHCSYSPIFGSVSHPSYQLHSFRIILRLRVQTQVTLYKVLWGHVMLPILHNTGILQRKYRQRRKQYVLCQDLHVQISTAEIPLGTKERK